MFKKLNISKILNENKLSFQAALAITFFFALLFFINIYQNKLGNEITQSKTQSVIVDKEAQLKNFIKPLTAKIKKLKLNFHFTEEELALCRNENLNYFVYHKDSLIAWTDNEVIPYKFSFDKSTCTRVVKLNDGYYIARKTQLHNYNIVGIFLLEHQYPFENEYLLNEINPLFNISKDLNFRYIKTGNKYNIVSCTNEFLFEINFSENNNPNTSQVVILFIFYFLILALCYNFIYLFLKRKFKGGKIIFLFALSVIIIRILLQFVRWPIILYSSDLFTPSSFAISYLLPSLGDLFLSVFSLFVIILVATKKPLFESKRLIPNNYIGGILGLIINTVAFIIYFGGLVLIKNLILNSNINFDISNFFGLNYLSIIGLIIITGILFIVLLLLYWIIEIKEFAISNSKRSLLVSLLSFLVILILNYYIFELNNGLLFLFFVLIIITSFIKNQKSQFGLSYIIPILLILSFITAIAMNEYVHEAEYLKRKSIVRSVAVNQDPQAEYMFHEVEKAIYKDKTLIKYFHNNEISFDSIANYIVSKYFIETHWAKYDLQATICDAKQELVIKPENIHILCNDFFYKNLISYGKLTSNKNLYHLEYGTGQINYLGLFRFLEQTQEGEVLYTLYLEINSKLKRKGFTKLLSEKGNDPFEKLRGYSLAAYQKDTLVENYGNFSYPEILNRAIKSKKEFTFIDKHNYNHLVYRASDNNYYVLSKKIPEKLTIIAPFSYLFILFSLLFLFFSLLFNNSLIDWSIETNFTARLQLTMIAIIIVSFTMISYFSSHYIITLNNEKNNQRLKDLSSSLQMEFEHKVRDVDVSETDQNKDYLQTLSIKFSKVFDTDINLYNLSGNLISATRPEIFDQNLLSQKINPMAYYKLSKEKESFYVTQENIGKMVYSSAYLPFHNNKKEVVAYLNLPYFARQRELQNEVSSFLMTLMNVYTFIIVLSIIMILLLSNYISRPLRMIKEKLQKLTLGSKNEKIEWKGEDEIGRLVIEYNRMVDQMAIKADLLAKSERESAWREMAKQVAHEIKNPLTPMKLSVQYLLRSWNEKDPDWEDRLHRLSETLIQQIDTLSDIATAFSDFAKMPKSNNEKIELNEIINNAIELYADYNNLLINFGSSAERSLYIYADRKQLLRVFNNLIKNAIQSFENNQNGFIDIDIIEDFSDYKIRIRDNGCGIPEDKKALIFVPNFTTKSKGTGLGLAMVKNIILNLGGNIDFESEEGKGTVFTIRLPKYEALNVDHNE